MAFWRLFYHVVWATKERDPIIHGSVEEIVRDQIGRKTREARSILHAVGGIPDHVHVVVSIPPTLTVAEYVRLVKGSTSHRVHLEGPPSPFAWQSGYGVFSLSSRQLNRVIDYVNRQAEHHAGGGLIPALERVSDHDDGPAG